MSQETKFEVEWRVQVIARRRDEEGKLHEFEIINKTDIAKASEIPIVVAAFRTGVKRIRSSCCSIIYSTLRKII
jgi:hypothetical protein